MEVIYGCCTSNCFLFYQKSQLVLKKRKAAEIVAYTSKKPQLSTDQRLAAPHNGKNGKQKFHAAAQPPANASAIPAPAAASADATAENAGHGHAGKHAGPPSPGSNPKRAGAASRPGKHAAAVPAAKPDSEPLASADSFDPPSDVQSEAGAFGVTPMAAAAAAASTAAAASAAAAVWPGKGGAMDAAAVLAAAAAAAAAT